MRPTSGSRRPVVSRAERHGTEPAVAAPAERVRELDERLARIELVLRQLHLAAVHEDRPQHDHV